MRFRLTAPVLMLLMLAGVSVAHAQKTTKQVRALNLQRTLTLP